MREGSFSRILVAAATTGLALAAAPAPALAQVDDPEAIALEMGATQSQVAEVVMAFKAALAAGDSTAALSHLHPELIVFEGGHAETLEEYRAGHLASDMEFAGAVEFETTNADIQLHPYTALWLSAYTAKGTFRGREIDAHGVESMVLVPAGDGWKILHIHWSSR